MLTMAILAIIGAFLCGFMLCGMFAVGVGADRSDRPNRDEGHDFREVALLPADLDLQPVRHPSTYSPVSSGSTRLQGSLRRRRSASSVRRDTPVARRRGARGRPSSQG
jgi:hypothetical protein